jgi:hypothetical protein
MRRTRDDLGLLIVIMIEFLLLGVLGLVGQQGVWSAWSLGGWVLDHGASLLGLYDGMDLGRY